MANDAAEYGVTVHTIAVTGAYWRVETVRHLPPEENRGNHHAYIFAFDEQEQRVHDLRASYSWQGQQPHEKAEPVRLDKPEGEAHGNIPIFFRQILTVWISDVIPSERVSGLHTMHPDEYAENGEKWNYVGHHSFAITFRRIQGNVLPPSDDRYREGYNRALDQVQAYIDSLRA